MHIMNTKSPTKKSSHLQLLRKSNVFAYILQSPSTKHVFVCCYAVRTCKQTITLSDLFIPDLTFPKH